MLISRSVTCPMAFPKRSSHGYSATLSSPRFRRLNSLLDHFIASVGQRKDLSAPDSVISCPSESKATSCLHALRKDRATGQDPRAKIAGGRHRCRCMRRVSRAHFEVSRVSNDIPYQLFPRVQRDTINSEISAPERASRSLFSVSLLGETFVCFHLCNLVSSREQGPVCFTLFADGSPPG